MKCKMHKFKMKPSLTLEEIENYRGRLFLISKRSAALEAQKRGARDSEYMKQQKSETASKRKRQPFVAKDVITIS